MKVKVLGCYGGNIPGYGMTSFLVNGTLALDAGWVSGAKPKHLRRIRRQLSTIRDSRLKPLEQGRTLRL